MNTILASLYHETTQAIDTVLHQHLTNPEIPQPLCDAMAASVNKGGKRLRPMLVMASTHLFDVPKNQAARVGAALELIHCYSLIHDDLPAMDNSDMRRGQPTCWREFGEATAILAGDSLLPLAFEILTHEETHPSAHVRLALIKSLAINSGATGMAGGQMLDLSPPLIDTIETAKTMQKLKTGCLISFACESGAILAQASPDDCNKLREFGLLLGLAYQIQDDLLDIEGTTSNLGKPIGHDSNKRSLVALIGVEKSKLYLTSLQDEMTQLIQSFNSPNFLEIVKWATTRQS
jgi:farnesyl diphosphate synthase